MFVFTVCLALVPDIQADSARDLFEDLMDDYKREVRPKKNFKEPLKVTVELELKRIIQLVADITLL